MAHKEKNSSNPKAKMAIGAGIAAMTAAAIAYFLVGPDGKKNRKKLQGWVIKMKGEIVEKLEAAKEITQPVFEKIVTQVAEKYKKVKHIRPEDLEHAVAEIKKQWKSIAKESSHTQASKKKNRKKTEETE